MELQESIMAGLGLYGPVTPHMASLIRSGVLLTFDTQMIIEQVDFHALEPGRPLRERGASVSSSIENEIEEILTDFDKKGLIGNFHNLTKCFGRLLFSYIATEDQQQELADWQARGEAKYGGFLMSDAGGPSIDQWQTVCKTEGEQVSLNVSKIWAIEGHRLDWACVVSANEQKLYPSTILVSPREFKKLECKATGKPFLDGTLQLGQVSGKVSVPRSRMLTRGGLASTSIFLSRIRPRFVRSLMGHLVWLTNNKRLNPSAEQMESILSLNSIAKNYCDSLHEVSPSLPTALATKFVSNRILLDLATTGAICGASDQRDLMAFTRMEGSSYRCLFEIYSKLKARRNG